MRAAAAALAAACLALAPLSASAAEGAEAEKAAQTYPALTSDVLFSLIASEVANQRNMPGSAYATLMATAKKTGNAGIAKRAFEIAIIVAPGAEARAATALWEELAEDPDDKAMAAAAKAVRDGRYEQAEPAFAAALAKDKKPDRLFERIYACFNGKKNAEAFPVLERLAKPVLEGTSSAAVPIILARMAAQIGNAKQALAYSEDAVKKAPENESVFMRSIPLIAAADPSRAAPLLESYLEKNPKADGPRLLYARTLLLSHREADARAQVALIGAEGFSAEQLYQLGVVAESTGLPDEASGFYRKSLEKTEAAGKGDADRTRFRLAVISDKAGRAEEAAMWYALVEKGALRTPARIREAALLSQAGQPERAVAALEGADPQAPDEKAAVASSLANLHLKAGDKAKAFEVMKGAVKDAGENAAFLYDTALFAEQAKDSEAAEFYLRKSLAVNPESAAALNALGYLLADRGERLPEARNYIEKAAALKPGDPYILDSLGWVWFRLGDAQKAVRYLEESIALRYDPETAAHLAEAKALAGDREAAESLVREELAKHPDSEPLLRAKKNLGVP